MSLRSQLVARLAGSGGTTPLYLPDLTLWYEWHRVQGSLPEGWRRYDLPQVARALGVPVWLPTRPWRVVWEGATVNTSTVSEERVLRVDTVAGTLTARWTLGPDGDWWQSEYPVKAAQDLPAALAWARARRYELEPGRLERLESAIGDDGLLALELPRRPYSDLLHDLLGWGEGLMLLGEEPDAIDAVLEALETPLRALVERMAQLPGAVALSPDNLDGQYISPHAFQSYLADSYRATSAALHAQNKLLMVHAGGPTGRILAGLAAAGVDGVEGIAGPPQGDTTLAQARMLAGPGITLWGGIPQDALLSTSSQESFEAAVHQAAEEARGDARMLLGVADKVPVEAELGRLRALGEMLA